MIFTKLWAKCIAIFGTRSRKAVKTAISANVIKTDISKADQPVKSVNQICTKKKEKFEAQAKVIEQQKKEI